VRVARLAVLRPSDVLRPRYNAARTRARHLPGQPGELGFVREEHPERATAVDPARPHEVPGVAVPARRLEPTAPTVILTNGSDGQTSDLWSYGAPAGLERGWNVVIYEGPGQGSMVCEQKIPFSAKWEQVVGALIDIMRHLIGGTVPRDDIALLVTRRTGVPGQG
jgi:hypothetical protein